MVVRGMSLLLVPVVQEICTGATQMLSERQCEDYCVIVYIEKTHCIIVFICELRILLYWCCVLVVCGQHLPQLHA